MPCPRNIGAHRLQTRADSLIQMPVPQPAPDPEIVYLSGIQEYIFPVKTEIVILNAECHLTYFISKRLSILSFPPWQPPLLF